MSSSTDPSATKAAKADEKAPEPSKELQQQKPTAALEEDDEFEDFPVEGVLDSPPVNLPGRLLSVACTRFPSASMPLEY